jgi:hypothetical protein
MCGTAQFDKVVKVDGGQRKAVTGTKPAADLGKQRFGIGHIDANGLIWKSELHG